MEPGKISASFASATGRQDRSQKRVSNASQNAP
jgi:hypothetical protein